MQKLLRFGILCLTLCISFSCSKQADLQPEKSKPVAVKQNKSASRDDLANLTTEQTAWIYERLSTTSKAELWSARLQRKLQETWNFSQVAFIERAKFSIAPHIFEANSGYEAIAESYATEALQYFTHSERFDIFGNVEFYKDLSNQEVLNLYQQGRGISFFDSMGDVGCSCRWGVPGGGCDCIFGACTPRKRWCGWFGSQDCLGLCKTIGPGDR
ncbi:MAG: hypothetical protein EAZ95_11415 [Bacteroidetes bacterium]|nr:MAG: hypothetical protein EAZ95_11415 [Bacteroidota bacterium]